MARTGPRLYTQYTLHSACEQADDESTPPALRRVLRTLRAARAQLAPGGAFAHCGDFSLSGRTSTQLAWYGKGAKYAKHRDVLEMDDSEDRRVFTAVYYLNDRANGGELRMHATKEWTDGSGHFDLEPKLDRLVLFDARNEHEVLESLGENRMALTQWWYGAPRSLRPLPPCVCTPLPPCVDNKETIFVSVASYRDREQVPLTR